jgi:hypothetical protein
VSVFSKRLPVGQMIQYPIGVEEDFILGRHASSAIPPSKLLARQNRAEVSQRHAMHRYWAFCLLGCPANFEPCPLAGEPQFQATVCDERQPPAPQVAGSPNRH